MNALFGREPQPRGAVSSFDSTKLRLAIFGLMIIVFFVALFSRLWFLQVLASENYRDQARENRVRKVLYSDPARGRILDAEGRVLVGNRETLALTADRSVLDEKAEITDVLDRVAALINGDPLEIKANFEEGAESPFRPVAIAFDVTEDHIKYISMHPEDFPGIDYETRSLRTYPRGKHAAHIFGSVGEITPDLLKDPHYKDADIRYAPGDIVGLSGLEYVYDAYLRGRPTVQRVVVDAAGNVIGTPHVIEEGGAGSDLVLSLDMEVQKMAEEALANGIELLRGQGYEAPGGSIVVLDPTDGGVVAMASYPTFDPNILADGMSFKEQEKLEGDPDTDADNALFFRPTQAQRPPGSTMKVVTAGAALATDVADVSTAIDCNGSAKFPPDDPYGTVFNNWTTADMGIMEFPRSLEVSCDTFYYELGWAMETTFDEQERFQEYARTAGLGRETGIDLPYEATGNVPDREWCRTGFEETKNNEFPICGDSEGEWLPGFSVNMSIGQGDMIATPLQMAVTYGAIASSGQVWEPRLALALTEPATEDETEGPQVVKEFEPTTSAELPLEPEEFAVIRDGLELVVSSGNGTASGAFAGFPLDRYPVAGKTGTAELGEIEGLNDAWFVSYAPAKDPEYVMAVHIERAGHGGESAAPISRQVWEGIFGIDKKADVVLSHDESG